MIEIIFLNNLYKNLFLLWIYLFNIINGQSIIPNACLMTFDNGIYQSNSLNSNSSIFICPSSCFTMGYITNQDRYPIFGNETYSGNSLICKSAIHDGRIQYWITDNSPILIQNQSQQLNTFDNTLRNGIFSAKSTSKSLNSYRFLNPRINENSLMDIAIEHRSFLYSQDESSTITCRSRNDLYSIEPIQIDNNWKSWNENLLKYFTFPMNVTRDDALTFCSNNNGTLIYLSNSDEFNFIQKELLTTIHQLFHYQRNLANNNTLRFFFGLIRQNQIKQWQSNVIRYNEEIFKINVNSVNGNSDYCTIIQSSGENPQTFEIIAHTCDDFNIKAYPLCRLNPSIINQLNDFIYRLETDTQPGNLTGVIEFCYELGGYPIYANNAYEWQIIQEIMLKDENFNSDYVYTGLISKTKQESDAYWMPKNISYNSSLNYLWFASNRGEKRTGYHLSKSRIESYYGLYDIDPYSTLNELRFCRKDDLKSLIKQSSTCYSKSCRSKCLNITLPSKTDNTRFGLYGCYPKNSLSSIVYTQSFPRQGDFIRPVLPMTNSVALRRSFNEMLTLSLNQSDKDVRLDCYEYINFDESSTLNDTIQLNCDSSNPNNKTFYGIYFKRNFNTIISIGFKNRRISAQHMRFIDYNDFRNQCSYHGIYHPYINQCICAPGFYGDQCQYSCPSGYYGKECDFRCQGDDDYCKGLLICLPDPYGCSCYSGWYGTNCNLSCPSDRYGPDCSYNCSCSNCNRFTGVCNCVGTECYQGKYNRNEIESRCSTSPNLAVLIAVPIASAIVLIGIIGGIVFWIKRRSTVKENLFENSRVRYSSNSSKSSIKGNEYNYQSNNIISERL